MQNQFININDYFFRFLWQIIKELFMNIPSLLSRLNISRILQGSYTPDCLSFVLDAYAHDLPQLLQYIALSGHGINQIGNFEACKQQNDTAYYLGFIGSQAIGFVGICFNNVCTADDVKQLSTLLDHYQFSSVIEPATKQSSMPLGGYILFGLLAVFLLVTLISTLFVWLSQRNKDSAFGFIEDYDYFSIQRSLKVFKRSGQIKFLNGLKALCFLIVIFGHELFQRLMNMQNILSLQIQMSKPYITLYLSYMFSVDIFFFLGGFMVGFLFLKAYSKKPSNSQFGLAILHRYLRFAPLFAISMAIYWQILPYIGSGPLNYQYEALAQPCAASFWRDMLFFGNFANQMCLVWGWYIQIDMQLFVLSLFLLYIYAVHSRKVFYLLLFALPIAGISYVFARCMIQGYHVIGNLDGDGGQHDGESYLDIYNKPWSRVAPYFLGLVLGVYYFNFNELKVSKSPNQDVLSRIMKHRFMRWAFFVVGLTIVAVVTYLPHSLFIGIKWSQYGHSFYTALGRISYCFGVCLILLPMLLGYSNALQVFLQWNVFQILSKLCYSCYLIHYGILLYYTLNVKTSQYVTFELVVTTALAHLWPIIAAGVFLTFTIELPFGAICDTIMKRKALTNSKHRKQRSQ